MQNEITGHPAVDSWLTLYEPNLTTRDYAKFCKLLCDLKDDSQQLLHKLRELILGGFLGKHGYAVEYERKYGLLEPDWNYFEEFGDRRHCGSNELPRGHCD